MRLLILEDNDLIRRALVRFPWPDGVELKVTSGLSEARDAVEEGVDLVLSDVMLGAGFGTDLHSWLTKSYPHLAEGMVFMTGGVPHEDVARHLNQLPNKVVEKPFHPHELLTALGMTHAD